MKRYNICVHDGSRTESPTGLWVLHSEAEAAIAAAVAAAYKNASEIAERRVSQTSFEIAAAIRARTPSGGIDGSTPTEGDLAWKHPH